MTVQSKRQVIDFLAEDHQTNNPKVRILQDWPAAAKNLAGGGTRCIMRWYVSLQGENAPLVSPLAALQDAPAPPSIYRYDWAFGIAPLEGFYWDWQKELCEESALAIHLVLEPEGDAPEAIPISATLSVLHPSRNTKSFWELAWPKIPRAAADLAKTLEAVLPPAKLLEGGLTLASNVLESQVENKKNWFLYQFLDEKRKCPTVEWRIHKDVLQEYGPLLRGSLFLAFHGAPGPETGKLRILLRPQIKYYPKDDICFIIPTDALTDAQQVAIEVQPQAPEQVDPKH